MTTTEDQLSLQQEEELVHESNNTVMDNWEWQKEPKLAKIKGVNANEVKAFAAEWDKTFFHSKWANFTPHWQRLLILYSRKIRRLEMDY